MKKKILNLKKILKIRKLNPKIKIGLAHGVFDLIHYGHIKHLQKAKENCDILVVSITSSKFINKGPNRPFYDDEVRKDYLSALSFVDYIYLSKEKTAEKIIRNLKPNYYFKGDEYEDKNNDLTNNITKEINILRSMSGKIIYTKEKTLSSSKIFNSFYSENNKSLNLIKNVISFKNILKKFQEIEKLNVLVIGDLIIDRYFFCSSLGKSPKEDLISVKNINEETYGGGIIATANHVSQFVKKTTLISSIGVSSKNQQYLNFLDKNIEKKIFKISSFPTIEKNRFLEKYSKRKLFQNLTNDFIRINPTIEKKIIKYLSSNIKKFDIVIANDFGHGLFTPNIRKFIQEKSKFLALNCQTNSSNVGYNFITKYKNADYLTIDEPEARLSTQKRFAEIQGVINILKKQIKFKTCSITRGEKGSIVFKPNLKKYFQFPVLNKTAEDTVGAGDAYFALSSLFAFVQNKLEIIAFIGNVAGALKVSYLGHRKYIRKNAVIGFIKSFFAK